MKIIDEENEENSRVIHIDIGDEMKKSYIDYAMSVIISRALPDVRDGLKPVHRRILYAMHELGFSPDKAHRKSARIVGEVLGKFHPHGDSSVYNAMVRMAQEFSIRQLLVDGHGNFGSVDGDSAAAMRYTEARMTRLSQELMRDIDKETVDFSPNFDETIDEPKVLPARFPNLLVNGSNGIAVGMATSIPPHNLAEIINATIHIIENVDATVEDLLEIVKGPDFPTGADILGRENIKRAYRTGRGNVIIRSKCEIEEIRSGKMAIIVTEIPYQVNKSKLLEDIADLVRDKKIEGITDLRDESNRNGIRVVIELRRDVNANVIMNKLYKHTQLQTSYSIILLALDKGMPKVMNLFEMLTAYIDHQKDVETRRVKYDLRKAEERAHILEGLLIALNNIDEIIALIKASATPPVAKEGLIQRFGLSEIQAQAILEMRLQRLTGLERDKIEGEHADLMALITNLRNILADEVLLMNIIKNNLMEIRDKYDDGRRTQISHSMDDIDIEDLIAVEDVVVTLTHHGYVKRVSTNEYALQKRGGRGKSGVTTKEEDFVENIFTTSTHDFILFFTNKGKMYRMKAYQIPEGSRTARGTAIVNLLQLDPEEMVTAVIPIKSFEEGFLVLCTKKGVIKKTDIGKFDTSRKTGLIAMNLSEDDELIAVKETTGDDEIIVITSAGKSIRFHENDVREMGRMAGGVRAIRLDQNDRVVALLIVDLESTLLVVSENGFGKRTELEEYRIQERGGKGIKTYNVTEKTGNIVGAAVVKMTDEIMLISSAGVLIRIPVNGITIQGRVTSGVTLMKCGDDTCVVSIALILESDENEEDVENAEIEVTEVTEVAVIVSEE